MRSVTLRFGRALLPVSRVDLAQVFRVLVEFRRVGFGPAATELREVLAVIVAVVCRRGFDVRTSILNPSRLFLGPLYPLPGRVQADSGLTAEAAGIRRVEGR